MASPPSQVQALLPDSVSLKLKLVQQPDEGSVLIVAAASGFSARCPECERPSQSVHSRYFRVLKDLPWQGSTVQMRLEVRRFRCGYQGCSRITFTDEYSVACAGADARRTRAHAARRADHVRCPQVIFVPFL